MSVALRGNLKDFSIADIFQLIGQQRKTGVLEFTWKREQVQLRFHRGAVVSAAPSGTRPDEGLGDMLVRCGVLTRERVDDLLRESQASAQTLPGLALSRGWLEREQLDEIEDLLTRETIFSVLRWTGGSFDFTAAEIDHDRSPDTLLGAEQILMDGLRMLDEWQTFADKAPADDAVFQRAGDFEAYGESAGSLSPAQRGRARRVFDLIDGRLAVRSVIDLSRLGTFDATRILIEFRDAGMIEPAHAPAGGRRSASRRTALSGASVRGWLCAFVAVPALLALALFVHRAPQPGPPPGVVAFDREPLAAVRAATGVRRVRHAIDAYRFSHGHWPEELSQLAQRDLLAPSALASDQGRPYYYAMRRNGAVLLAPER